LLHGFPQDASSWRDVEPLLHEAGLRTLAPDQRGYSPGARPARRADYRAVELVDDVLALLDAAGLTSAHVVGHDWGGAVAWLLAARYPERVRSLTVLSTPHPSALWHSLWNSRQALRSWYMLFFQLPVIPEFMLARRLEAALRRSGLPARFAAHNAQRMREPGALTGALNWYRALPFDRRTRLSPGSVPTTYIWSGQDGFFGRAAAVRTAAFVAGPYRYAELSATHWLPETHPAQVAALIVERVGAR